MRNLTFTPRRTTPTAIRLNVSPQNENSIVELVFGTGRDYKKGD
jgi:hypothetical protein